MKKLTLFILFFLTFQGTVLADDPSTWDEICLRNLQSSLESLVNAEKLRRNAYDAFATCAAENTRNCVVEAEAVKAAAEAVIAIQERVYKVDSNGSISGDLVSNAPSNMADVDKTRIIQAMVNIEEGDNTSKWTVSFYRSQVSMLFGILHTILFENPSQERVDFLRDQYDFRYPAHQVWSFSVWGSQLERVEQYCGDDCI